MGAAAIRTAFVQETEEAARMARRRQSTACELRKLSELRPLHDLISKTKFGRYCDGFRMPAHHCH